MWEVKSTNAFGLIFNGEEPPLRRVTRLDRRHAPTPFDPYKAMWGDARQGAKPYICITFNFDGLGQSGSFQNVRGVYIIEKSSRAVFFAAGDIRARPHPQ